MHLCYNTTCLGCDNVIYGNGSDRLMKQPNRVDTTDVLRDVLSLISTRVIIRLETCHSKCLPSKTLLFMSLTLGVFHPDMMIYKGERSR